VIRKAIKNKKALTFIVRAFEYDLTKD